MNRRLRGYYTIVVLLGLIVLGCDKEEDCSWVCKKNRTSVEITGILGVSHLDPNMYPFLKTAKKGDQFILSKGKHYSTRECYPSDMRFSFVSGDETLITVVDWCETSNLDDCGCE